MDGEKGELLGILKNAVDELEGMLLT